MWDDGHPEMLSGNAGSRNTVFDRVWFVFNVNFDVDVYMADIINAFMVKRGLGLNLH